MAKSIRLNTTSKDLGDTTLICMNFLTLFKTFTTSGTRKPKVLKVNSMKAFDCQNTFSHVIYIII
jgi:hypothetical protein